MTYFETHDKMLLVTSLTKVRHQNTYFKVPFLTRPRVDIFADTIKIVTMFIKSQKNSKQLEIMYQNTIYICIS